MEAFLHALSAVSVILILLAVGYLCSYLKWITPEVKSFISKYIMFLALPIMCAYSLRTRLTHEILLSSGRVLAASVACEGILLLVSLGFGKLLHLPKRSIGVFAVISSLPNAIFIGYPICVEMFGEECAPYVMIFYLVNASFAQLIGVPLIRWSGEQGGERRSLLQSLVHFLKTPSVLGVIVGFLLVLFDIHPPEIILSPMRYINNTVTPLALLLAGHIICDIGLRNLRLSKPLSMALLFRFILSPALSIGLCALIGVADFPSDVLAILAAMPVLTVSVVAAAEFKADEELAAQGIAISTLLCFLVIPVLRVLL